MAQEINIFTYSFPYGNSEQFLYEEVLVLARNFDKINLFPTRFSEKKINWNLPKNVFIYHVGNGEKIRKGKRNLGLILKAFLAEWTSPVYFLKMRYYAAYLSAMDFQAENSYDFLRKSDINFNALFYTYWFDDWTFRLAILKEKKKIKYLVTRIHGGDVYEHQHPEKGFFFPFRNFQIRYIDKIFPISDDGLNHLRKRYSGSASKLKLSYLGTRNIGRNPEKSDTDEFVLVSCSSFYHYKNVGLIPGILSFLKFPIKWIHIGNEGPEKEEVISLLKELPSAVKTEFKGQLNQEELFDFFGTRHIDLFINVSKSEGLPVSLMEAISFGIPIMGPDVGGIREIVNEQTGILFKSGTSPEKLAESITSFRNGNVSFNRNKIRNFWEENFIADRNYSVFSDELMKIMV